MDDSDFTDRRVIPTPEICFRYQFATNEVALIRQEVKFKNSFDGDDSGTGEPGLPRFSRPRVKLSSEWGRTLS